MAKNKNQKKVLLKQYEDKIKKSKGLVVVKPNGLTPNETNDFRKELFDFNASLNIVKNSIFKIALKNSEIDSSLIEKGEYAILFMEDDVVNTSKALKKFTESAKTKSGDEKIQILAGIYEGSVLTKSQVMELADMPSKEGSIALILGVLDNALSGVVNVLEDAPRSVASILDQAFKE